MVGVAETVTMGDGGEAPADDWVMVAPVTEEAATVVDTTRLDDELGAAHRGATLPILETTQEDASSV
jgi:hypothetical protein